MTIIQELNKSLFNRILETKFQDRHFIIWSDTEKNILLEALEKQVAKKPIEHYFKGSRIEYKTFCPNCKSLVGLDYKTKCCPDCGQRLKWSDEE